MSGQNYCVSCGLPIPDGQKVCSMCYGDLDYGSDGYYRAEMESYYAKKRNEPELKPCPFCGGEAYLEYDQDMSGHANVYCSCYPHLSAEAEDYNNRPIEDALNTQINELKDEIANLNSELGKKENERLKLAKAFDTVRNIVDPDCIRSALAVIRSVTKLQAENEQLKAEIKGAQE